MHDHFYTHVVEDVRENVKIVLSIHLFMYVPNLHKTGYPATIAGFLAG